MHSEFLNNPAEFRDYVKLKLNRLKPEVVKKLNPEKLKTYSSVLVPFGMSRNGTISLMLNKRSRTVPQPGDLCFPGGGLELPVDWILGSLLSLLKPDFLKDERKGKLLMSTMAATAIREGWEEIRLNPLSFELLGILPPQPLSMFQKSIVGFVCWIKKPVSLKPNREVEKIVWIPLNSFLNPENYALYRLYGLPGQSFSDFPCFLHQDAISVEILWGVTYRIVMYLLKTVLNMQIPHPQNRQIVPGVFDRRYLTGYEKG